MFSPRVLLDTFYLNTLKGTYLREKISISRSIFGKPGTEREIKAQFRWEGYFWKRHNPSLTQIVDFFVYHVFCSVNLRKHLRRTIVNLMGKWAKILLKSDGIQFRVVNQHLLIATASFRVNPCLE